MRRRRPIELFSISFLDILSGALGAVIILYVAIPKNKTSLQRPINDSFMLDILKKDLLISSQKVDELKKELSETKKKLTTLEEEIRTSPEKSSEQIKSTVGPDVGFNFKGKNIVFIIDTSYSMIQDDRMGQVKAGIKMLLTSLSGAYRVEIIQFPLGERAPFRSMWGRTREFKSLHRNDAFDFIYALRPSGGTPTRDTLLFVLKNYDYVSDIVLLSDGAPTFHNSNTQDDIFEILRLVREENTREIQINTIGVGVNFLKDKTSKQHQFLSLLASQNNGFFVGF